MKKPRDPNETVKRFFPFYPSMWLTSRKLRFCSSSARGILTDLMAMCWETGGVLEEPLDILAASVRETPRKTRALLEELAKWERITLDLTGETVKITVPHLVGIYEEAVQMIEAKRTAGSKGAEIRYSTPIADPSQTHSAPIAITLPDLTVPDTTLPDINTPNKKKPGRVTPAPRFVPPTIEEVTAYVQEKGYHFRPEGFVAYYETRNWKPKGSSTQMSDWHAACVTFEHNVSPEEKAAVDRVRQDQARRTASAAEAETHQREKAEADVAMARIEAMVQAPTPEMLERAAELATGATARLSQDTRLRMAAAELIEGVQNNG